MDNTLKRRLVIAASGITVVALAMITIFGGSNFFFKPDKVDTAKQQADFNAKIAEQRAEYRKMLLDAKIDREAGKEVLSKVIDEKTVKAEMEELLQVDQKITIPEVEIPASNIRSKASDQEVKDYFNTHFQQKKEFTEKTRTASMNLYHDTAPQELIDKAAADTREYLAVLKSQQIPSEAVDYHKSIIGAYESYERMIGLANTYYSGEKTEPWSEGYREWMVSNEFANRSISEIKELDEKYALSQVYADVYQAEAPWLSKLGLVNQAEAFGLFGVTFNFEIGNIMEEIKSAIASFLSALISRFLSSYVTKIEKSFQISNYLYYADALVTGQYTDDFLDKYLGECVDPAQAVNAPGLVQNRGTPEECYRQGGLDVGGLVNSSLTKTIDKQMIKAFMPQFNCGVVDRQQIAPLLQQRAMEYAGVDITQPIDVNRGDFYEVVNRVNHLAADAVGQELIAKNVAQVTTQKISDAIAQELLGTGKKAGRTNPAQQGQGGAQAAPKPIITLSVDGVKNAQLAGLIGSVALGTDRAQMTLNVASLVRTVITAFLNSFVFQSAAYLFKEQDRQACITGVPVTEALVPADIPDPGPNVIDNEWIQRCRANPEACAQGFVDAGDISTTVGNGQLPPIPDREPVLTGDGLQLSSTCFVVGEVPRLAIHGAPPNQLIYWSLYRQPAGEPVYIEQNFEDAGGPQMTNAQGHWPSATGSVPDQAALTTADIGQWTRRARVGNVEFSFNYRVVATRNECMPTR